MKTTTIKIHDTEWFETHCRLISRTAAYDELVPNLPGWKGIPTVSWLSGYTIKDGMSSLEGRVLIVEHYSNNATSLLMMGSRYMARGYWIPNWAIEWVKEEQYADLADGLIKAKEIIESLLPFEHVIDPYALTSDFEENQKRFHDPFRKAEQFLKEE